MDSKDKAEFTGNDNYGKPKTDYIAKIEAKTDEELETECESKIWLSAYASNNRRSDYHWHVDACYKECVSRNKPEIYDRAFKDASQG